MTDLAKLVVRFEAETAQLTKQLQRTQGKLDAFGKKSTASATAVGTAFGVMAAQAAGALAGMAQAAIDGADATSKFAQSAGVSTEAFSALSYAAELSGSSADQLRDAFNKLNKSASDTARGTGAAKDAFAALGVSVVDANGKIKSSDALLLDVAESFSKFENGAAKSAAAQAIFGESGARLLPLLNQGREGIGAMTAEADLLGIVLTDSAGKAAEAFNDDLTRLGKITDGVVLKLVSGALPALNKLTEVLIGSGSAATSAADDFSAIDAISKILAISVNVVANQISALGETVAGVFGGFGQLLSGNFDAGLTRITEGFGAIPRGIQESITEGLEIWNASAADFEAAGGATGAAATEGLRKELRFGDVAKEQTTKAAAAVRDSITPMIQALQEQAATLGMTGTEVALYRIEMEGANAAQLAVAASAAGVIDAYERQAEAAAAAAAAESERIGTLESLQNKHIGIITGVDAATRELMQTHEELETLLGAGRISADEYAAAMGRLGETSREGLFDVAEFGKEAARSLQSSFADFLFDPFSQGLDGMLKGFGQVLQRMIAEAVAADLLGRITGGGGGGGGGIGAALTGVGKFFGFLNNGGTVPHGQFAIAGENGPELVFGGSQVVSTRETAQMMQGGGTTINVSIAPQNNTTDMRRAAGQGAREGLAALAGAQRYA
jgi:hypothetical protein